MVNKRIKRLIKALSVVIGISLISLTAFVIKKGFNEDLKVNEYTILSSKVSNDLKVVQISDLHATNYGYKQSELITKIKNQEPDLIFITGDIMNEELDITNVDNLLKGIKNIAPVYYVTGNHEYFDSKLTDLLMLLKQYGIIWLKDENKKIEVNDTIVNVSGLDDPEGYLYWNRISSNLERINSIEYDKKHLSLLLSHRPELSDIYKQSDYDLVFCGHAHGGQVRIPFILNGVIAPNQGLFPKYTKGVYSLENETKMVVSAGLASNNRPRFFNNPDLTIVNIIKERE